MFRSLLRSTARIAPLVGLALSAFAGVAACNGCRSTPQPESTSPAAPSYGPSTVRIYALSNLAGALEPCGCTKDQLGGIDHLAAFLTRDRSAAHGSLFLAVGPTLFLDPTLDEKRGTQDRWKAEAISASLGEIGLAAWTPGYNDWAGGAPLLAALAKSAQGPLVAANLEGVDGAVKSVVRDVGGVKVGIVGVSAPALSGGARPAGVEVKDAAAALTAAIAQARAQGAKMVIGLAALPRGEALRLAERAPELSALLVGKPVDSGEANDAPSAPVLIGNVLVVQTSNHLQTVGVIDFFVQGDDYKFQDATGMANAEALASLNKRIRDYEARLAAWESDTSLRPDDLAARRGDLKKMRDEQARLANREPPRSGSFFRYTLVEVREKLGRDAKVEQRMGSFYKRVNEHNKTAFAGRKPPAVAAGKSAYTGIEVCSSCHLEERQVWDRTAHARAYATLSTQFKEYNLDCVSCHVTGYEKPGGSTVTMNTALRDVQCEECHGPGEAHVKSPNAKGLIDPSPPLNGCVSACHHPPHVDDFDPSQAKQFILGPGHGMPDQAPWPAWARDGGAH
ncbi:MAG TPA: multiheme c-type cytochrome [Polyangiaceae bacterium]|nr:multiheme c-type cytochrome [Polyangiaceae bacterium]